MEELTAAAGTSARTLENVAAEIRTFTAGMLNSIIEIGRRMVEAKDMLPHGQFGAWIEKNTGYHSSTAHNFMRLYLEYGSMQGSLFGTEVNFQTFGNLTYTKALALLSVPADEREAFAKENSVEAMSLRELKDAIRERDEARKACSAAEELRQKTVAENVRIAVEAEKAKADAANAEESRQKMESDMTMLKQELQALREHPVIDAVVQADETALENARQEVRDELREQLDKATAAKKKAEEILEAQKQKAEKELEAQKQKAEEKLNAQKSETDRLQQRIREMEAAVAAAEQKAAEAVKEAGIRNNPKLSAFEEYYNQTQTLANKMNSIILELLRDDPDTAGKLGKALIALGDMIKEAAAAKETAA